MPEASEAEDPKGIPLPQASAPETPAKPADVAGAGVETAASEQVAGEASDSPSADNGADSEVGAESEAGAEAGGEEGSGAEAGGAKRKRRRRRKRKGEGESGEREAQAAGDAAAAPGAQAAPGGGEARGGKRRDASNAPFVRFFASGQAARKHGFAVGEVVAGRVKATEHGSITVDLFGKALAYADEFEPREVPPAKELKGEGAEAPASATDAGHEPEGAAVAEVSQDAAVTSVGTQEAPVADAATSPGVIAAPEDPPSQGGEAAPPAPTAEHVAAGAEAAGSADASAIGVATDAEAAGHDHDVDHDPEHDHDHDADTTLTGEPAPGAHGPMHPAPVVPDEYPRIDPPSLGQVFRGRVGWISESGHIALVNRDVERKAVLSHLERYRTQRRRVQGLVFGFNRGGFDVLVEGVRAFCPASAMTLEDLEDPAQLLGHKLEFLLPASQTVSKDIIVSRRSILERLLRKKAKELVRSLEPGQRIKGRVTQVREFGIFVDIGGIDGLVHQSEMSYAHGVKPGDVAAVGDEVEVQVLRVGAEPNRSEGGGRKDRPPRVSLSMKALLPDPWDAHGDALAEGAVRRGKVTRTTDFGAFIELAPQIEGLLHITELGRDLKHANQAINEGDEVCVVVERADKRARRITLSKLSPQEMAEYESAQASGAEAPRNVRPGSRIKVIVTRVENRGLVVRVAGAVGKRARGYVPGIELGERSGDLRKSFPIGAEIEVKVVGIDRDGSLRCSPKALAVDEERRAVKDYRREAAKQGFGTFGDLLRAKLGQPEPK